MDGGSQHADATSADDGASRRAHGETFGVERMNAVSDGVFAIILTLLVLDLKLPDLASGEDVRTALVENWHVFVAWLISFVAIARFWVVHHAVSSGLRRCHTGTIALNFAVLGVASLVPFSADLIGNDRLVEPWSTAMFAANFALLSVTLGLLAHHVATEPDLLDPERPAVRLSRYRRHHLVVAPVVFLAAASLAFTHPYVSIALLVAEFAAAAWWSVRGGTRRADERRRRRAGNGDDEPSAAGALGPLGVAAAATD